MTSRRSLSPMQRLKVFETASGRCHLCEQRIQVGQKWDVEHVRPLALGGADDESNMKPAHRACHAVKTKEDVAANARAKRRKAKLYGGKGRSSWPKAPAGYNHWTRRIEG